MPETPTKTPAQQRVAIVAEDGASPFGASVAIGPHRLRADEPLEAGGQASGPDPYEYLLAGLGACTVMTVRLYANRKGWPLHRIEVRVRQAARAGDGEAKDVFVREILLEGDLSSEERQRLLDIAERCPVSRTLAAGVVIRSALGEIAP
jgi:putative redox protein